MKIKTGVVLFATVFISCAGKKEAQTPKPDPISLRGTWKLIEGTVIEKGDTIVTGYTKDVSFIKIINDTHFAFLQHDLTKGKGAAPVFVSGGGRYALSDRLYTEHLEYCTAREWEGNDFHFTIDIRNDTLTQSGIEKVESAGIDRTNIETYIRVKN